MNSTVPEELSAERSSPMLEVSHLNVWYGVTEVLRDVSFTVPENKIVSLLGGNGSGKTTVINALSGMLTPRAGNITFCGSEIAGLSSDKMVKSGIVQVPQGREVFSDMTVRENLLAGAYCRRDQPSIQNDLHAVETKFQILSERKNQKARTLSGGERQMLAIGRALMARPKLLMLDEPSLGLAPKLVEEMFQTVATLKSEGTTILLVEQNAYGALAIADYAYVLRVGEIVLEENAKSLLTKRSLLDAYLGET